MKHTCPACKHEFHEYRGYVYLMTQAPAFLKVGYSNNPHKRAGQVHSDSPNPSARVEVLSQIPGDFADETRITNGLPRNAVKHGPWFYDTEEIRQYFRSHGFYIPGVAPIPSQLRKAQQQMDIEAKETQRRRDEVGKRLDRW